MKEDDDVPESLVQGEQNPPELPTAEGGQEDMVMTRLPSTEGRQMQNLRQGGLSEKGEPQVI